jgi:hypothetical protein
MFAQLKPFIIMIAAVVVALVVYNMFIAGSSWFGHYEGSNNYDTDGDGNVIDISSGQRIAV